MSEAADVGKVPLNSCLTCRHNTHTSHNDSFELIPERYNCAKPIKSLAYLQGKIVANKLQILFVLHVDYFGDYRKYAKPSFAKADQRYWQ
jgi:hypothetical protein